VCCAADTHAVRPSIKDRVTKCKLWPGARVL
jgi:hypothetical protein